VSPALDNRSSAGIALAGVTRVLGGKRVLDGLDLRIPAGTRLGVVGRSGAGKSTLLGLVAGLDEPDEGTVSVFGQASAAARLARSALMPQRDCLLPWRTALDNACLALENQGVSRAEARRRATPLFERFQLAGAESLRPAQLSGGMRQRVCIARTLVMQPRLILLDEPFGALDQQTRLLMGDELLRLWREIGATVMLITHALDEAAMLSDRVGVMSARPGRFIDILTTGWPRERDSRIVADAAFGTLTGKLWSLLRDESMKAIGAREGIARSAGA
jgi:NitT/TauT family transport system ATP-binding protein